MTEVEKLQKINHDYLCMINVLKLERKTLLDDIKDISSMLEQAEYSSAERAILLKAITDLATLLQDQQT